MKKTNLVLMISAALTLAACGGSSSNDSAPADPTPPKTVTPTPTPTTPDPTPEETPETPKKPAKKPAVSGGGGGGGSHGGGSGSGGSGGSGGTGKEKLTPEKVALLAPFTETQQNYVELTPEIASADGKDTKDNDSSSEEDKKKEKQTMTVAKGTGEPADSSVDVDKDEKDKDKDISLFTRKTVTAPDAATKEARTWYSYVDTAIVKKAEDKDKKADPVILMPDKAVAQGDNSDHVIQLGKEVDGLQTAVRIAFDADDASKGTGTTYLTQKYSYSRFGVISDADIEIKQGEGNELKPDSKLKKVTYYSVGDFSFPQDVEKAPVDGKADYEGVAFINSKDNKHSLMGKFFGEAFFTDKKFNGYVKELKNYNFGEDQSIKLDANEYADAKKFYDADSKSSIFFKAKINGNHFETDKESPVKAAGSFYGPEAEEVGGVLSGVGSDSATTFDGAFGGKKQSDDKSPKK